jgi:hypothetical protein
MTDEAASIDLFPSTSRIEFGEAIDFLQNLVNVIRHLFDNGREPVLGNLDLTTAKKEACLTVEKVLRKLVSVRVIS